MARKSAKGYFVQGQFVALGSERDQEMKLELKGAEVSKTDLKRQSDELQKLGEALLALHQELLRKLDLPENLLEALKDLQGIQAFGGRRRQLQYVGKLMRKLDSETVELIRVALDVQSNGSAEEKQILHLAESWRERLLGSDEALTEWLEQYPNEDVQHIRNLIRQTRKDKAQMQPEPHTGQTQRKSKAYRELFQLVQRQLKASQEQVQDLRHFNHVQDL